MIKLNVSCPRTGCMKQYEIDAEQEKRLLPFFDKKIGSEIPADTLGDEWKGYKLKITGGSDKAGFPMMNGIMTKDRVRLLFHGKMKCYRPKRKGAMQKKSVRGCIVGPNLSVLCLAITDEGEQPIEGLTTDERPRRLGPKRANNIRKMFGLTKEQDVKEFVVRRTFTRKNGKTGMKTPKIQRLVTARRIQRKVRLQKLKKDKILRSAGLLAEYKKTLGERNKRIREESLKQKKPVTATISKPTSTKSATTAPTKSAPAPAKSAPAPAKSAPAPAKSAPAPVKTTAKGGSAKAKK